MLFTNRPLVFMLQWMWRDVVNNELRDLVYSFLASYSFLRGGEVLYGGGHFVGVYVYSFESRR